MGLMSIAVLAISTAAVLIRGASEAPALVIAAYRLFLGSLLLLTPAIHPSQRKKLAQLRGRPLALAVLSGILLAGHFATWIASLSHTNVASSLALVTAHPLFVALGSRCFLGERVDRRTVIGIVIGLGGIIWLATLDQSIGKEGSLFGDGLAFAGCLFVSFYFLCGRLARTHTPLWPYVTVSYTTAAVIMVIVVLGMRLPVFGYAAETYLLLLLLALIPQGVGHTLINRALRHLSAPKVSVAILGEVPVATALAWLFLGESVPPTRAMAVGVIIVAVIVALGKGGDGPDTVVT